MPSLKHCSNKYRLAREGINKGVGVGTSFLQPGVVNENVLEMFFSVTRSFRNHSNVDLLLK